MEQTTAAAQDTPNTATEIIVAPTDTPAPAATEVAPPAETPAPVAATETKGESTTGEIELVKPEEFYLDDGAVESIATLAKERGLSKEQAQELLDRQNEAVKSHIQKTDEKVQAVTTAWKQATMADKELGGDKFQENIRVAHEAVKRFASDEFIKALNETGFGNHPEVVRVFYKIGKAMREDRMVVPGVQSGGTVDIASKLYGNQT